MDNPWKNLSKGQKIKANAEVSSDAWWLHLPSGKYGFKIGFNGIVKMNLSEIRFKGADVELVHTENKSSFTFILNSDVDIDIFARFCNDLLSVPLYDVKQKYADALSIRMKQWMKFLQKLKNKEMDIRVQLGLIGELNFIQYLHNFEKMTYKDILSSWIGPEKADKDFMLTHENIEVKSCFDDEDVIRISNEEQLSDHNMPLFLTCYKFEQNDAGENLSEIIDSLKKDIMEEESDLLIDFEQKLLAVGFSPAINYGNLISVTEKSCRFYEVTADFPKIIKRDLPECISHVKYDLQLNGLVNYIREQPFRR